MSGIEVMINGKWVDKDTMNQRMTPNIEKELPLKIDTRVHWVDDRQSADYDATIVGKKYLFGAGFMYIIKVDNYKYGWSSIWSCKVTSDKNDLQYVYAETLTPIEAQ